MSVQKGVYSNNPIQSGWKTWVTTGGWTCTSSTLRVCFCLVFLQRLAMICTVVACWKAMPCINARVLSCLVLITLFRTTSSRTSGAAACVRAALTAHLVQVVCVRSGCMHLCTVILHCEGVYMYTVLLTQQYDGWCLGYMLGVCSVYMCTAVNADCCCSCELSALSGTFGGCKDDVCCTSLPSVVWRIQECCYLGR